MNKATLQQLSAVSSTRCQRWHKGGIGDWSPERWLVATMGELGELAMALDDPNHTTKDISGEMADTIIYLDLFAQRLGIDLSKDKVESSKFNLSTNDYMLKITGHLGEASNALKKLFRIEDDMANISEPERQLSTREAAINKIKWHITLVAEFIFSLANYICIDLDEAIKLKFNSTSEKYGFPERMV